jgi:hypothetical protein
MPWTPTSDDWRSVAQVAADLAFRVADLAPTEADRMAAEYDPSSYLDQCARAAELFVQSGGPDLDNAADVLARTASVIFGFGDGWEAMRRALKTTAIPA